MAKRPSRDGNPCPCESGWVYGMCCAPYHRNEREASDATVLMRSRFAAFALGEADYLWRTLHPDHDDRARSKDAVVAELARACRSARYERLRVLDARQGEADAQVLFLASLRVAGKPQSFLELSDFLHDGTGWRYLCGVLRSVTPADASAAGVRSIADFTLAVRAPLRSTDAAGRDPTPSGTTPDSIFKIR